MERTKKGVMKHRAKIYTEPFYFAMNIGREKYKERKEMKRGVRKKSISLKLINERSY